MNCSWMNCPWSSIWRFWSSTDCWSTLVTVSMLGPLVSMLEPLVVMLAMLGVLAGLDRSLSQNGTGADGDMVLICSLSLFLSTTTTTQ